MPTPGTEIGGDEFVKIPAGSTASVTLPDGSTKDLPGKAIVPGRWLSGEPDVSGQMMAISQGIQAAAGLLVGEGGAKTYGNGGGKA